MARPNGVENLSNYDTADRLVAISHTDGTSTALAEYGYALDANGNRTEVVVTGSAVANGTETYAFDELDRLTDVSYPGGGSANYAYDANGNRSEVTSGGVTTTYEHDAADQLQALRDASNAVLADYAYDPNGNLIEVVVGSTTDTFLHDWANRLTEATVGGTTAEFAYLADGSRASTTVGSTTTPYLWDRGSGIEQVLDDGSSAQVFGPGGLLTEDTGAGETWALGDALGSVRARIDASGTVVGTAEWDAFGNVRGASGSTGLLGWAGEQQDPTTGFVWLRSRDYDPAVGRFVAPDAISPSLGGTQGYSPYLYANNNPTTFTDPSGASTVSVLAYMAWVFECYLFGECRLQRKHAEASGMLWQSGSLGRAQTRGDLRKAGRAFPDLPSASNVLVDQLFIEGGGNGGIGKPVRDIDAGVAIATVGAVFAGSYWLAGAIVAEPEVEVIVGEPLPERVPTAERQPERQPQQVEPVPTAEPTDDDGCPPPGGATYYRRQSPTQTFTVSLLQEASREIWGTVPAGGGLFAAAQAYVGALPDGALGIEFQSPVTPDAGSPPGVAYWRAGINPSPYVVARTENGVEYSVLRCVTITRNTSSPLAP